MKLNLEKCTFRVIMGKLLRYIINQRGNEVCYEQVKTILDMLTPRSKKEIHKLVGQLALFNMFISKSSDKSYPFFKVLKKNKEFIWDQEYEDKLQQLKRYFVRTHLLAKQVKGEELYIYIYISYCFQEGSQHIPIEKRSKAIAICLLHQQNYGTNRNKIHAHGKDGASPSHNHEEVEALL